MPLLEPVRVTEEQRRIVANIVEQVLSEEEYGMPEAEAAAVRPPVPPRKRKRMKSPTPDPKFDFAAEPRLELAPPRKVMVGRPLPLFIASIGNPGSPYANTLHSAGHTLLNRLAEQLGYPQFTKDKELARGLVSRPPSSTSDDYGDWTLWQCPSYMNDSGKSVRAAYLAWAKTLPDDGGRLVIVHDELEKSLGNVTMKTGQGASAKGHNGLKSIIAVMGNTPFARIGLGIGRPISRERDDVARYVLRKMTVEEKLGIEGSVDAVVAKLRALEKG